MVVCAVLFFPGCQEGNKKPKGPDGKPLPGTPGGTVIPDPPYNLTEPPMIVYVQIEDGVLDDMKKHPEDTEGEVEMVITVKTVNPDPPPPTLDVRVRIKVKWKRNKDGSFQFTTADGVTVAVKPTADGKAETKTYIIPPPPIGIHYGEKYFFVGKTSCTEAIWVQYVRREFEFKDNSGGKIPSKPIGPKIDKQVPYAVQAQPAPGVPAMEDGPGYSVPLGEKPRDSAPKILDKMKKAANVNNSKITKATEVWSFWTYLICLKPTYKVVGHFEWGFTITVDVNNPPYIALSNQRTPVWTSGR